MGTGDPSDPNVESLFDANEDPLERVNVIEEQPEVAAKLRVIADDYLAAEPAPWGTGAVTVEMSEMEANQLRALGYAVP